MLSGEHATVPTASIWVDRANRTRKEVTENAIAAMAESIRNRGLINALVVNREHKLIAGETRWLAYQRLGYTNIPVQWADTLDENELLAIEIEENIKRTDLPWQDQVDALKRYHDLRRTEDPEWSASKTAEAIGLSLPEVSARLDVAKEIAKGNERVIAAPKLSTAKGVTKRVKERAKADALGEIELIGKVEKPTSPIITADFKEWVQTYDGPPFSFLNCDFPYGINADKFAQGGGAAYGGYEDTPELYWSLVDTLLDNKEKLLGQSAHIIFWFSMKWYAETLEKLREHFWVDPYPLIWHKTDNKGTLPDPERGPRRVYEVAFLCSHGDRKILSAVSNTFGAPTVRMGEHMSEKNPAMLEHFFRMCVDGTSRVLDPTCGSGSALRAAASLGAQHLVGLEINPEFAEAARRAWEKR